MSDGLKLIFKSLIKVSAYILAFYLVFNIFAFAVTYARLMGVSHVVMQTAVENNYIPAREMRALNTYLQEVASAGGMVDSAEIYIDTGSGPGSNEKKQYGNTVTVGVTAHFRVIWPLITRQQLSDPSLNMGSGNFASDGELKARRDRIENNPDNNIEIFYTVPGLKYYPDLELEAD